MPVTFSTKTSKHQGILHTRLIISGHDQTELAGKNIVQLSDLHYGPSTKDRDIELIVRQTNDIAPDMIVFTGDYVQKSRIGIRHRVATGIGPELVNWKGFRRDVRSYSKRLEQLLKPLDPPQGIYAVFGNHDHHEGLGSIRKYLSSKFNWLVNTSLEPMPGLSLSGIDDLNVGKPDLKESIAQLEKLGSDNFKLLLSHNPDIVISSKNPNKNELLKTYDLVLCGHTHGGQLRLPFLPPPVTRTRQKEFVAGLGFFQEKTPIYVNQGCGFGAIRLRTFCPREITILAFE